MRKISSRLTLFFEAPFWVGIFEHEFEGRYEVCKITFGAEPKDCEIYNFILKNYNRLRFSPSLEASALTDRHINPKRMRKNIDRHLQNSGVGTKAQQALKLQQEQVKSDRKSHCREQREAEKERQFVLRQNKRREKRRGH